MFLCAIWGEMVCVFPACFSGDCPLVFPKFVPKIFFCGNCWQKMFECELLLQARWRLDLVLGGKRHCFLARNRRKNSLRLRLCFSKVRPEDIFSDIVGEIFRVRTFVWERFLGRVW